LFHRLRKATVGSSLEKANSYQQPKILPGGSRIVVTGAFDNSPQNLANPDPTAQVRWGDQSSKEMFVGFIDYAQ
jgi:hypothetical protein